MSKVKILLGFLTTKDSADWKKENCELCCKFWTDLCHYQFRGENPECINIYARDDKKRVCFNPNCDHSLTFDCFVERNLKRIARNIEDQMEKLEYLKNIWEDNRMEFFCCKCFEKILEINQKEILEIK